MPEDQTTQDKLRKLQVANDAYSRGVPFMTEQEYHHLWQEIRAIDPHNPELYHTSRDPSRPNTRPHLFTIMGTQKAFDMNDMRPFLQRFKDQQLLVQPKYDGIAAVFYRAETDWMLLKSGDGKYGEEITRHLPWLDLSLLPDTQYVSAELLIPWSSWSSSYGKNPRNVVAGWMNRNDLDSSHLGLVLAVPHELSPLSKTINCSAYSLEQLSSLFLSLYDEWHKIYPMDGLMIKAADPTTRTVAGNNGTVSLWSVAWKPPMQLAWSTITAIEWNTGRSGRVVPKIHYEPLTLCSTENSQATANNARWLKDRSLHTGAKVLIGKAGEIIPQIIRTVNSSAAELPETCPICGAYLSWNGVHLVCTSDQCLGRLHRQLHYFCSPDAMYIQNIGEQMIENLLQNSHARTTLQRSPWALLEPDTFELEQIMRHRWGDGMYKNFLDSTQQVSGNRNPAYLIAGLGYHNLGYKTALKCFQAMQGEISKKGLQQQAIENFILAFRDFKRALEELQYFTFAPIPQAALINYSVTGPLSLPRSELVDWLASYRWNFVNAVTRYTTYLIVGELNKETEKLKRARALRVKIIYEHQLPNLLKEQENERDDDQTDSRN